MKEISVVVIGEGRFAQALTALITSNQSKLPGQVRRVFQYMPPESSADGGAPAPRKAAAHRAGSDDATMMGIDASAFSKLGAVSVKPVGKLTAGSDDSTMTGMSADALASLAGLAPGGAGRPAHRADSDDATMAGFSADAFQRALLGADAGNDANKEIAAADLILLAVPAPAVRRVLRQIRGSLHARQALVHLVDGFLPAAPGASRAATLISDVVRQETPLRRIGALAGPALAEDLMEWSPAALVCGSGDESVIAVTRQALGCPTLRIYGTSDLIGIEVARAMSSVVALASGICNKLEFGTAARAFLVSRGTAEIAQLGCALGGRERTFLGLAGIGALMVASERRDAADFQLGRLIASGVTLAEAQRQLGQPGDSADAVRYATSLATAFDLRTPIFHTLHRILFEKVELGRALMMLLEDPHYTE